MIFALFFYFLFQKKKKKKFTKKKKQKKQIPFFKKEKKEQQHQTKKMSYKLGIFIFILFPILIIIGITLLNKYNSVLYYEI